MGRQVIVCAGARQPSARCACSRCTALSSDAHLIGSAPQRSDDAEVETRVGAREGVGR